ncbi:MAG TPA: nuclear transport factor 2 family protein [Chthonomonadaceae bacterium]|nr:nuclear transport factor 2 family protein [Chthonomonadaceae bacterium]
MANDMEIQRLIAERELTQVANLLFFYTDLKDWRAARSLFVDGPIEVDMSSLVGGEAVQIPADDLLAGFDRGLHAGKASHHMATNYRIAIAGDKAELQAQGYAWNRLMDYQGGSDLWETWGSYRLTFQRTSSGWKLDGLRYYAKYNRGNEYVRTHTLA